MSVQVTSYMAELGEMKRRMLVIWNGLAQASYPERDARLLVAATTLDTAAGLIEGVVCALLHDYAKEHPAGIAAAEGNACPRS